MFHCATLLPYDPQDPQQLTKRKFLECNTAMIVFKDGPPPFDPLELVSDVTCIVIIVELLETATPSSPAKYRVAAVVRDGVAPFGPDLPRSGEFLHGEALRDFILAKVVNGVQTAMDLEQFRAPTRKCEERCSTKLCRKSIEK